MMLIFCIFGLMLSVGFLVSAVILALVSIWTQDDRQEYMSKINHIGE